MTLRISRNMRARQRRLRERKRAGRVLYKRAVPIIAVLWLASLACYIVALREHATSRQAARSSMPRLQHVAPAQPGSTGQPSHPSTLPASRPVPAHVLNVALNDGPPYLLSMALSDDPPRARAARILHLRLLPATSVLPRILSLYTPHAPTSRPEFSQVSFLSPKRTATATRTATPTPTPTAMPTATQPVVAHTAQVWVTGYDLNGTTATGMQAGPGICAVDPSYIPLGAHITIAGFGSCFAEDTGPAVVGAHIDVWVPDGQTAYSITGWYTASW